MTEEAKQKRIAKARVFMTEKYSAYLDTLPMAELEALAKGKPDVSYGLFYAGFLAGIDYVVSIPTPPEEAKAKPTTEGSLDA